jgi:hypothetical protein
MLVWWMMVNDGRFVADNHFFILPVFLFLPEKLHVYHFFFIFQFQSLCFLLIIFILDPFIKKNYVFNLVLSYKLSYIICFQFGLYSFDFWFFSLALLLKFYWFSISSIRVYIVLFFFNLALILFIFFLLLKFFFFFQFNPPI